MGGMRILHTLEEILIFNNYPSLTFFKSMWQECVLFFNVEGQQALQTCPINKSL